MKKTKSNLADTVLTSDFLYFHFMFANLWFFFVFVSDKTLFSKCRFWTLELRTLWRKKQWAVSRFEHARKYFDFYEWKKKITPFWEECFTRDWNPCRRSYVSRGTKIWTSRFPTAEDLKLWNLTKKISAISDYYTYLQPGSELINASTLIGKQYNHHQHHNLERLSEHVNFKLWKSLLLSIFDLFTRHAKSLWYGKNIWLQVQEARKVFDKWKIIEEINVDLKLHYECPS